MLHWRAKSQNIEIQTFQKPFGLLESQRFAVAVDLTERIAITNFHIEHAELTNSCMYFFEL